MNNDITPVADRRSGGTPQTILKAAKATKGGPGTPRPILTLNGMIPRPARNDGPDGHPSAPDLGLALVPTDTATFPSSVTPHPKQDVRHLATVFEAISMTHPTPLAIGSHTAILDHCKTELGWSRKRTRRALRYYVCGKQYHHAVLNHDHRVNLDGTLAAPITDAERAYAQASIDHTNKRWGPQP